MGIYGYCVLPRGHEPRPGQQGIAGHAVAGRDIAGLAVWVSEMARPEAVVEHVTAHNLVVEAGVTEEVTPVPLRFGQWAAELDAFAPLIAEKADWYRERLGSFAGAMEFGLRVLDPERQASAQVVRIARPETGTAYMEALRASAAAAQGERAVQEQLRADIAAVMTEVVREERVAETRTPHGVVNLSHLVSREHFEVYRERVHELRAQHAQLRFLLSGPWVPYSFAT